MVVIGFFRNLFYSLPAVFNFINKPLNEISPNFPGGTLGEMSILSLFSIGVSVLLVVFMAIHLVRLFVGG